jgi:hypothetical protein
MVSPGSGESRESRGSSDAKAFCNCTDIVAQAYFLEAKYQVLYCHFHHSPRDCIALAGQIRKSTQPNPLKIIMMTGLLFQILAFINVDLVVSRRTLPLQHICLIQSQNYCKDKYLCTDCMHS